MVIINLSRPLTEADIDQIIEMVNVRLKKRDNNRFERESVTIHDVIVTLGPSHLIASQCYALARQIIALMEPAGWDPIIIIPPQEAHVAFVIAVQIARHQIINGFIPVFADVDGVQSVVDLIRI